MRVSKRERDEAEKGERVRVSKREREKAPERKRRRRLPEGALSRLSVG